MISTNGGGAAGRKRLGNMVIPDNNPYRVYTKGALCGNIFSEKRNISTSCKIFQTCWIFAFFAFTLRSKIFEMENTNTEKDFTKNWVSSSRFLFYVQVAVVIAFVLGGCYSLYEHRYKGKPEVEVPDNTLYDPKYK